MLDVYEQLQYDLGILDAGLTRRQAGDVIQFLKSNSLIDYDNLKEFYLYNENEE